MSDNRTKITALLMSLALLIAVLLSAFYIADETNHSCIGDHCPICHEMELCETVLTSIGTAFFTALSICFGVQFLRITADVFSSFLPSETLITLKVKLSD